jgi:hypothetical protein
MKSRKRRELRVSVDVTENYTPLTIHQIRKPNLSQTQSLGRDNAQRNRPVGEQERLPKSARNGRYRANHYLRNIGTPRKRGQS